MPNIATVSTAQVTATASVTEQLQGLPGTGPYEQNLNVEPGPKQYGPNSTPPVLYRSVKTWTLDGAGEATIDLTALPGMQDDIDGTGLKVQVFRVWGSVGNGALRIANGAANPYDLTGEGDALIYPADNVRPFILEYGDGSPEITDVSGVGASQIDLSGTIGDAFTVDILLG